MYFFNRAEAGRKLAEELESYDNQHATVVALSPGAVLVGAQIAMRIHTNLMILMTETINIPGEPAPLASMTTNTSTYNSSYSSGQIEEFVGEYHGLIEEQRVQKRRSLIKLLLEGNEISKDQLRKRVVILVSDGLQNGAPLEVAADFLKPVKISRLVIVTPLASVGAVDKMHLIGDEIHVLSVAENMMDTNHYYDNNVIPDQQGILKITKNIALSWHI